MVEIYYLQEQLNKISSQELHIVNTTANSGWIVESGSLSGMTADDLEEHGAETGLVLEYNEVSPLVKSHLIKYQQD